jgi:predicted CXXCH cytochrome family protein
MMAGMILCCQCSPYTGKSLLNFFFDGVPEGDSSLMVKADHDMVTGDFPDSTAVLLVSYEHGQIIHYPYGEGECDLCHNEQALGSMLEPEPALCYTCHEDLSEQYSYLHGPVAGGYCTACHDPHKSENEKLLKLTGEALCSYCHEARSVLQNEMHQDLDGMLCTDCHNPHGGDNKYILQ